MAKLVFVDGDARLQEVQTLFFQGSSADQRATRSTPPGQIPDPLSPPPILSLLRAGRPLRQGLVRPGKPPQTRPGRRANP